MQPARSSTSYDAAYARPDASSGNPMQLVGILLETLDHHMCDRLDSIETQLAGLGIRIEQGFSMDDMGRGSPHAIDIDVISTDLQNVDLRSKDGEHDALQAYPRPDELLQYIPFGASDQDRKKTKEDEEADKARKKILAVSSEKQQNSSGTEKEAKQGAPSKYAPLTLHKEDMVHALHSALGHKSKNSHTEWHGENRWQDITSSVLFQVLSVSTIIINGFLTGLEADSTIKYLIGHTRFKEGTSDTDVQDISLYYFRVADCIVLAWWIIELFMHMLAQGRRFFRPANPMFSWNMFDVLCVIITLTEIAADIIGAAIPDVFSSGYLRLLRICRMVRIIRLARVVRFLTGVRKLIIAVQGALSTLVWALVLLTIFLYVYSLMMGTIIMQHYVNLDVNPASLTVEDKVRTEDMDSYYGGVIVIMSTLFEAITGGDWIVTSAPFYEISKLGRVLWFSYISFVIFGLLNVFTGIFVESATKAANSDREIVMQAEKEDENSCVNRIRQLFDTAGVDGGHITEAMLQELMLLDDFKAQLNALGLHTTEAHGLFKLLDGDNSGSVSVEEFISGCLRLKGGAQSVDMVTMLFETNKLSRKFSRLEEALDSNLGLHMNLEAEADEAH